MRGEPVLAQPKGARGSRVLAKETADAKEAEWEKLVKAAVRRRDPRCRWPEAHKCRFALEAAHILDASLGGAMATENLIRVCGWIHRRGPESIHGKQLKVEKDTSAGADAAVSFWKQDAQGVYYLVAREIAPFVLERD
jgi:hypothetical protein